MFMSSMFLCLLKTLMLEYLMLISCWLIFSCSIYICILIYKYINVNVYFGLILVDTHVFHDQGKIN